MKRTTFWGLIEKKKISIPIIQRDYAQGREDERAKELRKRLIREIIAAAETKQNKDFNFIYGTNSGKNDFFPIDGQQRLTTLYLFTWFIATLESKLDILAKLPGFTYRLRTSSESFFDSLLPKSEEQKSNLRSYCNGEKEVEDFPWFKAKWLLDPTVKSALVMLDEIRVQIKEKDTTSIWNNISNADTCPFILTPLSQNKANEGDSANSSFTAEVRAAQTYINMNARGKVLNDFENLKALLDKSGDAGKEFVSNYEKTYIHRFFKLINGEKELASRVEEMDRCAIAFLRNLYYDLSAVSNPKTASEESEIDFIRAVREKSLPDDYFAFAEFCLKDSNVDITEYSKPHSSSRPTRFRFLLRNWYRFKGDQTANADEWIYMLKNLGSENWEYDSHIEMFYSLTELVVAYGTLSEFWEKKSVDSVYMECKKIKISFLKEVKLKYGIFGTQNTPLKYDYFKDVEDMYDGHIMFLLWMSGYWEDKSKGSFENLEKYVEYAKQHDLTKENDFVWEKLYYLECRRDEKGVIVPPTEKVSWNPSVLVWITENPDPNAQVSLQRVKNIYDDSSLTSITLKQLLTNKKNSLAPKPNKWLYYVLNREWKELFEKLEQKNNNIYMQNGMNFFSFVLKKDLYKRPQALSPIVRVKTSKILSRIAPEQDTSYINAKAPKFEISASVSFKCEGFDFAIGKGDDIHYYSYEDIKNDEDTFEQYINTGARGAAKSCCDKLKQKMEDFIADLEIKKPDLLYDLMFSDDLQSSVETLTKLVNDELKTFNLKLQLRFLLTHCLRSGQRDIIIEFKALSEMPDNITTNTFSHSSIIKGFQ